MLTPTVRRTLSPRGQTPILDGWDRRDRLSAISCITVSPKRKKLNLYFLILADNRNARAEDTVAFLELLRDHLPGPLVVIGDRNNIHDKSRVVQAYLAEHPEVHIERLPAYVPELLIPAKGLPNQMLTDNVPRRSGSDPGGPEGRSIPPAPSGTAPPRSPGCSRPERGT